MSDDNYILLALRASYGQIRQIERFLTYPSKSRQRFELIDGFFGSGFNEWVFGVFFIRIRITCRHFGINSGAVLFRF